MTRPALWIRGSFAAVAISAASLAIPLTALAQTASPRSSTSPATGPSLPGADALDQVVLSGSVVVPKGTSVGEIVIFHGRAVISGSVTGDVVVLDGPITISSGYVTGNVVALNGPIRITGPTLIGGDVLGGERVVIDPGAKVGGQVRERVGFTLQGPLAALGVLLGGVAIACSLLLLGLFLLLLAPGGADRVATAGRSAPFASLGWGLAVTVGLPLVSIALMVSVVGLPLGLTSLLAWALVLLVGLAWTVWTVGRAIVPAPRSRFLAFLAGWAIVALLGLVPFLNLALWGLGSVFGLGAMVLAAWRARPGRRRGRHRAGSGTQAPIEVPEAVAAPVLPVPAPAEPIYPSTSDD